jgi:hypothetical protein
MGLADNYPGFGQNGTIEGTSIETRRKQDSKPPLRSRDAQKKGGREAAL